MDNNYTIYTTTQVAKICKVAPRTVTKWFDSGKLQGYKIPLSQTRRIPEQDLIEFMKKHSFPQAMIPQPATTQP